MKIRMSSKISSCCPTPLRTAACLLLLLLISLPAAIRAEVLSSEIVPPTKKPDWLVLPFAFSTDATGFALGVGGFVAGWPAPESVIGAATFRSNQDAAGFLSAGRNIPVRLLQSGRLYSDFDMSISRYAQQSAYYAFKTPVGQTRPGSSGSSDDQLFSGSGWDHWMNFDLKYAMPWGDGREKSSGMFWTKTTPDGNPTSFPVGWNPLEHGRSWVGVRLSRRTLGFDPPPAGAKSDYISTNSYQIYLKYDGTDKPVDPSCGNKVRLAFRQDPGWGDSYDSWTDLQLDGATHIPLGENSLFSQQVLALNLWTDYSPSYTYQIADGMVTSRHAPPFYTGANLGGLFHMRAYTGARFNDKAAVYYSSEYRGTLRWNPAQSVDMLSPLDIKWFQLVGFAELGNVAPTYGVSRLHSDMKYDLGVGLRMNIKGAVARIDYAVAPKNTGIWFMIGHAF